MNKQVWVGPQLLLWYIIDNVLIIVITVNDFCQQSQFRTKDRRTSPPSHAYVNREQKKRKHN